jgi:hypothetical protein
MTKGRPGMEPVRPLGPLRWSYELAIHLNALDVATPAPTRQ